MAKKWEVVCRETAKQFNRETGHHDNVTSALTLRLEVPGGWLYRYDGGDGACMVFVPEQGYVWRD